MRMRLSFLRDAGKIKGRKKERKKERRRKEKGKGRKERRKGKKRKKGREWKADHGLPAVAGGGWRPEVGG